jgi:hypothetical protein
MKSKAKGVGDGRCCQCGCATDSYWHGARGTIHLCGECVQESIEDFGAEFPEELIDDLPPDDFEDGYSNPSLE